MKHQKKTPAAAEWEELCKLPWFGLQLLADDARPHDVIGIGYELIAGVQIAAPGLIPGCYAVRCRVPAYGRHGLRPDWGSLVIRPTVGLSWVLFRRDGHETIVPDGRGGVLALGMGGAS